MWGFFAIVGVLACLVVVFGVGFIAGVVASNIDNKEEDPY